MIGYFPWFEIEIEIEMGIEIDIKKNTNSVSKFITQHLKRETIYISSFYL